MEKRKEPQLECEDCHVPLKRLGKPALNGWKCPDCDRYYYGELLRKKMGDD